MTEKTVLVSYETPDNDRRAIEKSREATKALETDQDVVLGEHREMFSALHIGHGNGRQNEEEEEMTQERLQSLLEDIKMEGGLDDEEMTEERVNSILEQVRQAEKVLCSVPGWRSEMSEEILESSALASNEEGR